MRSIVLALAAWLPLFSPYKDVSQDIDPAAPRIASSIEGGAVQPLLQAGHLPPG
ncbi:MAG: hypothetical protein HY021_15655 [Burkholderiales bacterium]|nr:hypothetical protein [Burkholderiales bacterium]